MNVPLNPALKKTLIGAVREQRVAGCYLIVGPRGTGKTELARYLASALCCTSPKENREPCGLCHACRRIAEGNHVDVTELFPEEGKPIPVDTVREMLKSTYVLPTESDWRIFILGESDKLRPEAQNALLKSIEEPRPNTVFLLLTEDHTKLLPTVRSRAVRFRTELIDRPEMTKILVSENFSPVSAEEAAMLAQGSLGEARRIASDPEMQEARRLVTDYFHALMEGAGFTRLSLLLPPASLNRKDLLQFLALFKLGLRDLLLLHYNVPCDRHFFSDSGFAADLASVISPGRVAELFDFCNDLQHSLERNANLFSAASALHMQAKQLTRQKN